MKVINAAKFNETQFVAVLIFTAAILLVIAEKPSAPMWFWLFGGLIWPTLAYISNLALGDTP